MQHPGRAVSPAPALPGPHRLDGSSTPGGAELAAMAPAPALVWPAAHVLVAMGSEHGPGQAAMLWDHVLWAQGVHCPSLHSWPCLSTADGKLSSGGDLK